MANPDRNATSAVELQKALQERPYEFDFYSALRLLENAHRDRPRIGHSKRPSEDPVRLAQEPSTAFAPSTIAGFDPSANGGVGRLAVLFLGLFGPHGPLPLHLTEYARERQRQFSDPTFIRFADLFHHRILSLFYRSWASAQPAVQFDRPADDRFATYIGSLLGVGMPTLRGRDAMPDLAKLHYAGRLSAQVRNAEGLVAIVEGLLGVPVAIQEFVGEWLDIPETSRCRLGESEDTGTLGRTASIGSRTWQCAHKFRIECGPVSLSDYRRLLPDGDLHEELVATVRNYVGDELSWDIRLILRREDVPRLELGAERLGWTSWLGRRPIETDAGDLLLNPLASGRVRPREDLR